jgi:soluble lytic murein transglycosylase
MMSFSNLKSSALTFSKISIVVAFSLNAQAAGKLSDKQRKIRLKHAHELLGRYYKKSSVTVGESIPKINSAVYHWTRDHLPPKYKDQSGKIAQTIIDVSTKNQFDPVFLMSVIEGESSWRPDKIGGVGEIGLMQLRPTTAKWIAKRAGVKWTGDKTLFDPCKNIKIGAAYLTYLRDRFDDHARLYLAAYNMGQTNVDEALDKKIWPKDYPIHVMKRYVAFYENVHSPNSTAAPQQAQPVKREITSESPSVKRARPRRS